MDGYERGRDHYCYHIGEEACGSGKQPVVDLDEDDDDDMEARRAITRWNHNEEILLAETWIEHSQDANIEKDQQDDVYWNLIMHDFNSRIKAHPRTKNMMTEKWTGMHSDCQRFNTIYKHLTRKSEESNVDLVENAKTSYIERCDNLQELFGPDPRERLASKQRASKKQKSVDTSSAGGSIGGSTGGSQSESVSLLVSQNYRRKCNVAERAYKAKGEKEVEMMQCRELEFLMLDPSTLSPAKRAIIGKKTS
nr:myb-like domain, Myb/SANT-like DNA-binding domain protein [Tanacetum cinerariifolium]